MAYGVSRSRHLILLAALFGLLSMFVAAGPGADTARAAGPCNKWGDKESTEITNGHARSAVLCLLNRERASQNVPKLDRSKSLQRASQRHNEYMQNHRCFSHQCSGEAALSTRLKNVGWLTGGLTSWSYGENIAYGGGKLGTPRSIVRAWMNSSGHRANILNRTFDEVGVGYTKGTITSKNANGSIITTDFGFKVG